jgi:membrane protein implicated in regulation of membrane protease activity
VPDWVIWLLVAAGFATGELMTLGFFLGPIAIAACAAALVAAVGGGVVIQTIAFIVLSIASLGIIRPIARRHVRMPAQIRTGTAALVGARATVLERVDSEHGSVKIGGEIWTARPFDEDHVFEPGTRVDVLKIDGATALVSE